MLSVIILIISVIACFVVGGLVLSQGIRDRRVVVYSLVSLVLLVMSVANFLSTQTSNYSLIYIRIVMASSSLVFYLGYLLVCELSEQLKGRQFYGSPLFYITIAVVVMDCTSFLFPGTISSNPPQPILGLGIFIYFLHFIGMLGLIIYRLYIDVRDASSKREYNQYKMLIAGFLPAILLAPITSFILPRLSLPQTVVLTPLYAVIFMSCVGYAIVRHGLFDVRRAAIRTMAYILAIATLSVVYYYLAYVLSIILYQGHIYSSVSVSPINIALALLLAFLFQPIKHFFDQVTNDIFYKMNYNVEDFFKRLDKILSSTADLRSMLERTANEIGQTLKSEQASFFINLDDEHYITAGTDNYVKIPRYDGAQLSCGQKNGKIIIASLLPSDDPVRKIMLTYRLEIAVPLIQGRQILGCLCLGDHLTSGYTNRDIKTLSTVSSELVIGIRNALAVNEVRELNSTLQQRINNATRELRSKNTQLRQLDKVKDDFVSIASHQLRTPLTGIKGYISMILEGDAGKITRQQREFLNQAFVSSERMARLINDFLNLSRIQTGKFAVDKTPQDLKEITKQEIDNLQSNAAARQMKLVYTASRKVPPVDVDEEKIRQVIMNFIDNAIYYSHDKSNIYINLDVVDNCISVKVRDNGIGVPNADKSQLFTKFFRADNAKLQRPDGTGVGLYLAKKIIDAHGGKIIFESKEGKGSTFGFALPISSSK